MTVHSQEKSGAAFGARFSWQEGGGGTWSHPTIGAVLDEIQPILERDGIVLWSPGRPA